MNGEDPLTLWRWIEQGVGLVSHIGIGLACGMWWTRRRALAVTSSYIPAYDRVKAGLNVSRKFNNVLWWGLALAVVWRIIVGADEEMRWFFFWFQ